MVKNRTCKYPGCRHEVSKRGNCEKHYQRHKRAIERGETSWHELEELGLVDEPRPGPPSDYDSVLATARKRAD